MQSLITLNKVLKNKSKAQHVLTKIFPSQHIILGVLLKYTCRFMFGNSSYCVTLDVNLCLHLNDCTDISKMHDNILKNQVAQRAMIAHHGASIMFGDTIVYDEFTIIYNNSELETVTRN